MERATSDDQPAGSASPLRRVRRIAGSDPWFLARGVAAAIGEAERGGQVRLIDPPLDHPWWKLLSATLTRVASWPRCGSGPLPLVIVRADPLPTDHPAAVLPKVAPSPSDLAELEPMPSAPMPPVRLTTLPRSGEVPWATTTTSPNAAITEGLSWVAARESALIVLDGAEAGSPLTLVVAGLMTGEGRRVVVHLPEPMPEVMTELAVLGRLQRPLTVITGSLPRLALPGWWMVGEAQPGPTAAQLTMALLHEWPTLIVAGDVPPSDASMPLAVQPPMVPIPGSGTWLRQRQPGSPAVVCTAPGSSAAWQAVAAATNPGTGCYCCTSLQPLPEADLRHLAFDGPVLVADDGWTGPKILAITGTTDLVPARTEAISSWLQACS